MSNLRTKILKRQALPNEDRYVSALEAARFIGVQIATLAQWRHHKRYDLAYVRIGGGKRGGRCYYRVSDLQNFCREHTRE